MPELIITRGRRKPEQTIAKTLPKATPYLAPRRTESRRLILASSIEGWIESRMRRRITIAAFYCPRSPAKADLAAGFWGGVNHPARAIPSKAFLPCLTKQRTLTVCPDHLLSRRRCRWQTDAAKRKLVLLELRRREARRRRSVAAGCPGYGAGFPRRRRVRSIRQASATRRSTSLNPCRPF
ncbi:hypothetical protein PLANPX_1190 [Lacipirellula parvula]|uniref:Uncharacterized protein n=1 Tax=Lacipirellula parvula TaxID=2650471 RepID=A0A5K7X4V1_9BACT|nr:hypothetical protein PLANPX_1190 [Lacipirellula parvula]